MSTKEELIEEKTGQLGASIAMLRGMLSNDGWDRQAVALLLEGLHFAATGDATKARFLDMRLDLVKVVLRDHKELQELQNE